MMLKYLKKRLKHRNNKTSLGISVIPLYLVALVPFTLHLGITFGFIEYFSWRRSPKLTNKIASQSQSIISERVLLRLDNYIDQPSNVAQPQNIQKLRQNLNNLLLKLDVPYSTKIMIIEQNGSVLASNFGQKTIDNVNQEVISYVQRRLLELAVIEQSENFQLEIEQQEIFGQVTPWQNKQLGLDLLIILAIPKFELTASLNQELNFNERQNLLYLFPTAILGLLIYFWIAYVISQLSYTAWQIDKANSQGKTTNQKLKFPANPIGIKEFNILAKSLQKIARQPQKTSKVSGYLKSSLLADLSHELRSPLNAILGFAQIMEQETSMTRSQRENLVIINRSGKRLLSTINDLVDLSKIETARLSLEYNSFDLFLWLDQIEQRIKLKTDNQGLQFSLLRHDNLPQYISVDERRLCQILLNLIDYSLRYTKAEKLIMRVACSSLSSDSTTSSVPQSLYFEIENTDFAVTATEITDLLNPIASTNQEHRFDEGSPLRLTLSRQLAQLMEGDISVKNNNNLQQGITLRLNIQTKAVVDSQLQIPSTSRKIIGLKSDQPDYRILVVDDSKTNRQIMIQLLERVGFEVQEAVNGKEAVEVWLRWQPHMIWMDIRMPVMNGYEATEQIKSYNSSSKKSPLIVALTASSFEAEKELFQASGCDDFVGKPFSENIIFDKITQHLGVRYVYDNLIQNVTSNFQLTANALEFMPEPWLIQLEEATARLDSTLLTELLQQIPASHFDLKEALQKQINNFDFDKILSLVQQSKKSKSK